MLMFIGIGLCISAYYIYHNKESVLMNLAKAGVKLEDIYLTFKGMRVSYLVPDHENHTLIDQFNKYYLDRYVSKLSHDNKYNKSNNDYFVILKYNIKRNTICFVKNSFTFNDIIISEEDVSFSSPIILCSVSIYENNSETKECKKLFEDIDITECLNYLVNRNSRVVLSNNSKFKVFWIYYLNYFLQERNIYINSNNLDAISISWNIMEANMNITNGNEILIETNDSETNIRNIDEVEIQGFIENENEYDNIDDIENLIINFCNRKNINNEVLDIVTQEDKVTQEDIVTQEDASANKVEAVSVTQEHAETNNEKDLDVVEDPDNEIISNDVFLENSFSSEDLEVSKVHDDEVSVTQASKLEDASEVEVSITQASKVEEDAVTQECEVAEDAEVSVTQENLVTKQL